MEKLHEQMITETDALNSLEFKDYFVILPSMKLWDVDRYLEVFDGRRCAAGFSYCSGTNTDWLSVEQLRTLLKEHVDGNFIPGNPAGDESSRKITLRSNPRELPIMAAGS
jgi:UDP-N-acetylglucosamine 4,6-dehydratase